MIYVVESTNSTIIKNILLVGHSGLRSYVAERLLKQAGFKAKNLDGAFSLYNTVLPEEFEHV